MSLITLQLGQCGNQLGLDLHNLLASEAPEDSRNSDVFFRRGSADQRVARTLLLDMEPKVVQACMRKARLAKSNWCYDSRNAILQQSGSGACTLAPAPCLVVSCAPCSTYASLEQHFWLHYARPALSVRTLSAVDVQMRDATN